ncbi:uncharacterized protein [Physcomitrium patens]|uniref:Uncharacterized protein n=1 Tax=Physcomitrium patens TaxID=3218 RepID=A9SP58_PHYPA|nr:uncharacterized protein LOC112275113 [Physcomitrium patens]PNR30980.1 hypothetical protein PHYPA_027296 [Physcomitrium patens]|eukprot:XP_024360914.1 uncharacterized protein LOC112275113 [Physcomitrella patens]
MNFFKKAQEFADTGIDHTAPPATAGTKDAGFGGLMSTASDMFKAQNAPTENAAPATSPGGRAVPTNEELMESSQVLLGAAQGQKIENTKLAGAAGDILSGLAAYGKLDEGQYSTYIKQAEDYLQKYSGEDAPASVAKEAAVTSDAVPAAEKEASEVPVSEKEVSEVPAAVKEVSEAAPTESAVAPAADTPDRVATSDEKA